MEVSWSMATKREPRSTSLTRGAEDEALDTLNAEIRAKGRRAPNSIRRSIEAEIESKAKKRRSGEAPASSGLKRGA